MNQIINNSLIGLNKVGGMFYDYAASVFIQTALLVILLFIIDLLLRKRIRAVFRYCLWLLVIVKLILPPTLSLPTGIGYWTSDRLDAVSSRAFDAVGFEYTNQPSETSLAEHSNAPADGGPFLIPASSTLTPVTWQAVLFVLWLTGVLAFLALLVQRARFVRGLIAASEPAKKELLAILEQSRRQVGLRWDISLRTAEAIPSPAVCGFFRPTILIPTSLVGKLSPEALRATLIHELAHIKRYDLWVNSIQTFLQVVYFYNPFVWLANSIIRKVCEEAVDETVLVTLGGQAEGYSNTLIDISEAVFWRADLGLRLIGVAESKKALQWRIRHMLTRPIPKSSKLGVVGIAVLFAIAAVLLPMAKAEKPNKDNKPLAIDNKGKPTKLLYQAAAKGDIVQVKNLIAQGADVNASDGHEEWTPWTPLLAAADGGHAQVIKLLLENGAKPDVGDSLGLTPLHHAIFNEDGETVRTLISGGADVNKRPNKDDDPPLFYAVWQFHAVVKTLIDAGADVNAEGVGNGWTPLHNALQWAYVDVARQFIGTGVNIPAFQNVVLEGDLNKVRQIVESGTDVDARDKFGWTPAYWALSAGQKEVAEYLLSKGADVTAKTNDGCTLLHQAGKAGFADIARQLIDRGADVNAATAETGRQPLADAAGYGHGEIVKLLMAKRADINATFSRGRHPLGEAASAGHEEVVKLLIAGGADVNLHAEGRGTALHAAANSGHTKIVDMLIANGADVNLNTRNGTPLHRAAYGLPKVKDDTSAEIVEKLLAKGADVNAKDPRQGRMPLHQAVYRGRYKTAEFLIAAGANVNATDNEGKTPLSYAKGWGRTDIVELLLKHGAEDDTPTANNNDKPLQSLHGAAVRGDIERVKQLVAEGADVNAKGFKGKTPLLRAAGAGHLDIVKVLLENGADVDVGGGKFTPLFHPIWDENIDIEMVRTLIASGADVNAHPKGENTTPLFYAVYYNRPQVARILIEAGADVNARSNDGLTPLHVALRRANAEMTRQFAGTGVKIPAFHNAVLEGDLAGVKELVESGTDVDTPDEFGWTPTCWAVSTGREEVARYLLNQGADVSAKIEKGRTILHQASRAGLVEVVKYLIDKGAEVDAKCDAGATALQYAALSGQEAVVRLLIANGASINFTAKDGTHPLGDAARSGHENVVKLLLASGAQVNFQPEDKMQCGTALHAAAAGAHSTIIDILIEHGADVNAVYKGGTPLTLAVSSFDSRTRAIDIRRSQIVQKLLKYGADIDAKHPQSGATPLYDAFYLGRYRTAEVLIAAGANVNTTNNEGITLLALAKQTGHTEIVELLLKHGAKE